MKWEIKCVQGEVQHKIWFTQLEEMGEKGWELVTVTVDDMGFEKAYFKRPKQDESLTPKT